MLISIRKATLFDTPNFIPESAIHFSLSYDIAPHHSNDHSVLLTISFKLKVSTILTTRSPKVFRNFRVDVHLPSQMELVWQMDARFCFQKIIPNFFKEFCSANGLLEECALTMFDLNRPEQTV